MLSIKAASFDDAARNPADAWGFLLCEEDSVLPVGADLIRDHGRQILHLARKEGFKAKQEEWFVFYPDQGHPVPKIILGGLGPKTQFKLEALRKAVGGSVRQHDRTCRSLRFLLPSAGLKHPMPALVQTVAEAAHLAFYRFTRHRKVEEKDRPKLERVEIAVKSNPSSFSRSLEKAQHIAEAVCLARDWVNEPPSHKPPEALAKKAAELKKQGLQVTLLDKQALARMGMNGILSVSRGSIHPPYLVHLIYKPSQPKKKIGLVGKGIAFDSGGLSLKSPEAMEEMKMDMAGAAAVLAVLTALPRLRPPVEVHGFMPLAYNLPGPDAIKPGDVFKAYNGKTVEVLNTDAEGRLVLADALSYASEKKLDAILDLATLTGAALIALGSSVTGAMTNAPKLLDRIVSLTEKTGEKIWELPLVSEYKEGLKSKVADLRNISSVRREAGAIVGGLFLEEFVGGTPWIHFDIAGTAWTEKPAAYCPPGGTGAMVRTLLEYLCSI